MQPILIFATVIFLGATLIQLVFWLHFFSKLARYRSPSIPPPNPKKEPFISVVICARNEAQNLQKNLNRFLSQTYRSFELILVDDHSTDNSAEILEAFQKRNPTFRIRIILNTKKLYSGKKEALEKGILAASGPWILVTDADCIPDSDHWISGMMESVKEDTEIVLGYSPYQRKHGWLNRFIRFETLYTAIQYFSLALAGIPYMGVGRNLLYRKLLFEKVGGFKKHLHLLSGDDDLFVNQVATATNTEISIDPKTFVTSTPANSWGTYYRQKVRHFSAGPAYRRQHKILLGSLTASHFLHYTGGIVLLLMKTSTIFVFFLFVLRICIVWIIYGSVVKKLQGRDLLKWIPVLDFSLTWFYVVFSLSLLTRKPMKWK